MGVEESVCALNSSRHTPSLSLITRQQVAALSRSCSLVRYASD